MFLFPEIFFEPPKPPEKSVVSPKRKRGKRRTNYQHLEEVEVEIKAPPEMRFDKKGEPLVHIGFEESTKIHRVPGKFQRIRYKREKLGYGDSRDWVYTVPPVKAIVPKGLFTDDFIHDIVIQKYFAGCPLYRQIQLYSSEGVKFAKSTLSESIEFFAKFYEPVVRAILVEIFLEKLVHIDETPIKCQGLKSGAMKKTYFWAYKNNAGCYFKHGSRSHEEILEVFRTIGLVEKKMTDRGMRFVIQWIGNLMTDDYIAYEAAFYGSEVILMACMTHCRRKFVDLAENYDLAKSIFQDFNELYKFESEVYQESIQKNWDAQTFYSERGKVRDKSSRPVLEKLLHKIAEALLTRRHSPSSALGKALMYVNNLADNLKVYLDDGELPIDNNTVEQRFKGVVIGRKNYLFVGTEEYGAYAAICYSLIESCRMHEIDPRQYLAYTTKAIHEGVPACQLTPNALKQQLRKLPVNF